MQGAGTNESLLWDVSRVWSGASRWASEVESDIASGSEKQSGKLRGGFCSWNSPVIFTSSSVAGPSPAPLCLTPGWSHSTVTHHQNCSHQRPPFLLFPFLFFLPVLPFIFIKCLWSSQHTKNQNTEKLGRHEFCLLPRANDLEHGISNHVRMRVCQRDLQCWLQPTNC